MMDGFLQDVRVAVRSFVRVPEFTALVVTTLALGIGVTAAMFSVVDGVLFTELPYNASDRMAVVWNRHVATGTDKVHVSGPDYVDYRDQARSFEDYAFVHNATDNTLTDGGGPAEQVDVGYVSTNFFSFLGANAVVGTTFSGGGEPAGNAVVISHGLWARRYGSDSGIVGRTIQLSGNAAQVIGVAPEGFRLFLPYAPGGVMSLGANDDMDMWRAIPDPVLGQMPRSVGAFRVIGRLAPGVTFAQAQDEFRRLAVQFREAQAVHASRGTEIDIVPLQSEVVGHVRAIVLSLFGAVFVVLLIACANVANLVSVQANRRARELAVRMALGAHKGRVLRQLLTEYGMLAATGAVIGLALAAGLVTTIVSLAPANVPLIEQVDIDLRAVGFAIFVSAMATIAFGMWPALRASSADPARTLTGSRGDRGPGNRFRSAMVIAEVALSAVLLVGGGLLIRTFVETQQATLGFDPAPVLTARIAVGRGGAYADAAARSRYWTTVKRDLDQDPAFTAAGLVWPLPFTGQGTEMPYNNTGGDSPDWGRLLAFNARASAGYFEAMQAEIVAGRSFDATDDARAETVAIIDDQVASSLYPASSAVGRTIWLEDPQAGTRSPLEIVGVVRHIRHSAVSGDERGIIYRPVTNQATLAVVTSTAGPPASAVAALRRTVSGVDANVPTFDERTLAGYLDESVAPTRFTMVLASILGALGLMMALVGLYGVIAYAVSQRRGELGIRIALGAGEGSIVSLIIGHGAAIAGAGIAIGLVMSLWLVRVLDSMLVGVPRTDPITYAAVTVLLAGAALIASYVPARRAARVDPAVTLREE